MSHTLNLFLRKNLRDDACVFLLLTQRFAGCSGKKKRSENLPFFSSKRDMDVVFLKQTCFWVSCEALAPLGHCPVPTDSFLCCVSVGVTPRSEPAQCGFSRNRAPRGSSPELRGEAGRQQRGPSCDSQSPPVLVLSLQRYLVAASSPSVSGLA